MKSRYFQKTSEILWYLLIFLLPFTSLPLASQLLHSNMVAAPSIIILALLLVFFFWSLLDKTAKIQPISYPLLLFGCLALVSSLLSFWLLIPIQKEFSIFKNIVEGLGTLLIGISFYLISINFFQYEGIYKNTIRIIMYSYLPLLVWCLFQFYFGQILNTYPEWMFQIQKIITTSGILYRDRLTGFAFEPSWLAHQMNMFYIPIWISATVTKNSCFKKWKFFIVEDLFLGSAIFILIFSKSRVGWITFAFMFSYLFYLLNRTVINKILNKSKINQKRLIVKFLPAFFILVYLLLLILGLFLFSKFDPRMESMFRLETYQGKNIYSIANEFVFAERVLYWQTGWKIFNDFPIFGVGLENVGFFFRDYLPSFAWALDEPRHLIYQATYQGNIKNLWLRLLAETGIAGFIVFVTWLLLIFIKANQNQKASNNTRRYLGIMGKLALLALLIEGFSIDSFALPYYWVILGLVSINPIGPKNVNN